MSPVAFEAVISIIAAVVPAVRTSRLDTLMVIAPYGVAVARWSAFRVECGVSAYGVKSKISSATADDQPSPVRYRDVLWNIHGFIQIAEGAIKQHDVRHEHATSVHQNQLFGAAK